MATRKFYEMMGGFGGETDYKKLYYRECNVTSQLREELEAAKKDNEEFKREFTEAMDDVARLGGENEKLQKEIAEIKNMVEKEPVAFLLSNALRLPKERLEALTEALIERTDCGTNLKKEIERVKTYAARLCVLHSQEQEGLSTVTPEQWFNAVNKLTGILGEGFWDQFHKSEHNL